MFFLNSMITNQSSAMMQDAQNTSHTSPASIIVDAVATLSATNTPPTSFLSTKKQTTIQMDMQKEHASIATKISNDGKSHVQAGRIVRVHMEMSLVRQL
jgi:hypothetical protein